MLAAAPNSRSTENPFQDDGIEGFVCLCILPGMNCIREERKCSKLASRMLTADNRILENIFCSEGIRSQMVWKGTAARTSSVQQSTGGCGELLQNKSRQGGCQQQQQQEQGSSAAASGPCPAREASISRRGAQPAVSQRGELLPLPGGCREQVATIWHTHCDDCGCFLFIKWLPEAVPRWRARQHTQHSR